MLTILFSFYMAICSHAGLVAGGGDSIMEGYSHHTTAIAGGGVDSGDPAYDPMAQMAANASFGTLSYTNMGYPGYRWDQVYAVEIPWITNSQPRWAVFHCGINDIVQGYTWNQTLTQLNLIKSVMDRFKITMILDEIYPDSGQSDAIALTVRTWNTNYLAWGQANGVLVIPDHDQMGQLRVSTGHLDDLKSAYDQGDGVHLSPAGVRVMSLNILNAVTNTVASTPPFWWN